MSKNTQLGNLVNGLFVDSTGNVGIGTTSPNGLLGLSSSSRMLDLVYSAASNGNALRIDQQNAGGSNDPSFALIYVINKGDNPFLTFNNGTSNILTFTKSGNLGIGTSSPTSISGYGGLTINGTSGGYAYFNINGVDTGRLITDSANFFFDNVSTGALIFRTTSSSTERMRLDTNGQLGINTTPPTWFSNFKGLNLANGSLVSYTTNGSLFLSQNTYFNASGSWTQINTGTAGQYSIDGVGNHLFYTAASVTGGVATTLNERMRILLNGNVGIGTGAPLYKTHIINGGGNAFLGISNQGVANGDRQIRIGFGGNGSNTFAEIQGTRANVADDVNVVMQAGGGNVGIGATGPSQKLEVAGTVLASSFLSATGLSYPAINTWTTFYTMAAQRGIYSVIIGFSAGTEDIATWFAYGTLFTQGSAGAFSTLSNGSLVQMRVSGLNIQVLLTPGASFTRELSFKVIRT
jgi:hypothetical protein